MAGRAIWVDLQQNGVGIAIQPGLFEVKVIAGHFTFVPQVFSAAAVEPDLDTFYGTFQGARVHIAHHQHLAGVGVLSNGG